MKMAPTEGMGGGTYIPRMGRGRAGSDSLDPALSPRVVMFF